VETIQILILFDAKNDFHQNGAVAGENFVVKVIGFIVNHQGFEIIGREEFEFQLLLQGMFLFDRLFDQLPHI
jgi:nitric oxide reductase large subunit